MMNRSDTKPRLYSFAGYCFGLSESILKMRLWYDFFWWSTRLEILQKAAHESNKDVHASEGIVRLPYGVFFGSLSVREKVGRTRRMVGSSSLPFLGSYRYRQLVFKKLVEIIPGPQDIKPNI